MLFRSLFRTCPKLAGFPVSLGSVRLSVERGLGMSLMALFVLGVMASTGVLGGF